MGITILEGDFGDFAAIEPAPGGIKYWAREEGKIIPHREFAPAEKLEFVQSNSSGSGFSPLWGAVGMEAIGPTGLLLGANGKKTIQTIYFKCTLKDGRYFVASTSQKDYQNWRLMLTNKHAESIQAVAVVIAIALIMFVLYLLASVMS